MDGSRPLASETQLWHIDAVRGPSTPSLKGGPTVGRLGFGAMRITGPGVWGPPRDERDIIALLRRAVEREVSFIDTADSYGPGASETLIAKALFPYPPGSWAVDCRPDHLRRVCGRRLK